MIPYYILPTINIGPLILHTWGLFAGLAFAVALFIALKEASRKNISEDSIFDLAILILLGGVVGARSAYVLENWDYFSRHQAEIISFKEGGLMFLGGAIGVVILVGVYLKKKKLDFWNVVDALVPSFAAGEFIGRIGCALTDLHVGTKTSLPWAQEYIDGTLRHPISIYMSLNGLSMFIVLWFLRKKIKAKGALFSIFVLWYSGTRFFLDFLRCNDLNVCDPRYSGYTPSQYISSVAFVIVLIFLINILKGPLNGGKNHMAEQQNGSGENKGAAANENKDLQGSVVSYTEVSEVIIESGTGAAGDIAGKKYKIKDMLKKPWAHAAMVILMLVLGAVGASVYYNKMYYGKMFEKTPFVFQGKTWVSYSDPIIKTIVINDPKCIKCNAEPIIKSIKSGLAPTISIEEIAFDSQKGKDLVSKFNIKSVPAFIFDQNLEKLETFKATDPEYMKQIFTKKDDQYFFNPLVVSKIARDLGVGPGRYINLPAITAEDRTKGPESAPVTIISFNDFAGQYDSEENNIINQALKDYPDKVRFVFKHLPSSAQPQAQFAAEAAECAGEQGKFFEMADTLFAKKDKLDPVSITRYVWNLKLDAKKFKECTDSGKFKAKIANDAKTAAEFGIGGTPVLFIGDEFFPEGVSFEQLKVIIDAQLAK